MTRPEIHPDRKKPRIRPLKAWTHMQNLLRDNEDTEQVFHIIEALNGNALYKAFGDFKASEKGRARLAENRYLPDYLDQHDEFWKLPTGTVGRAYVEFMEREGLTAAGLVAESDKWYDKTARYDDDIQIFANRLRDTHDLCHILSGYGRDQLGEAALQAFSYSQNRGRGSLFIGYMGGRDLNKVAPKNAKIMKAIAEGKRNGKLAQTIAAEDIPALLKEPLEEARKRLGINPPTLYKNALSVLKAEGYKGELAAA